MKTVRHPGKATRRTKYSSAKKRAHFASLAFETLEQRILLAVDLASVDMTGLAAGDDLPVPSVLDPSVAGTHPDLSANGRYLVFESDAEDLRDNDGNGLRDIFVRDLDSGVTTLISVTPDGISADADSYSADISDDGRFVTFVSSATNLIRGEVVDNGFPDVYLRDRDLDGNGVFDELGELANRTFLLSRGFAEDSEPEFGNAQSGGEFPVGSAFRPVISGDGSTVVFGSQASNLIDPATGSDVNVGGEDIFAVITTNVTKREVLTLNLDGDDTGVGYFGEGEAEMFAVSQDGSVVVFHSRFSNIADTVDDPFSPQIFVRSSKTERISQNVGGIGGDSASRESVISRDGRHIAFVTPSTNLVEGDQNGVNDVFVFDRESGLLTLVSRSADPLSASVSGNAVSPSGISQTVRQYSLSISDDGRFVSYSSLATDLVRPADGTAISDIPGTPDIFVFDRDSDADGVFDEVDVPGATETILVSINFDGTAAGDSGAPVPGSGSRRPTISGNGRFVAFASTAIDLLDTPTSGTNVFVRDLLTRTTYLASPSSDDEPVSGSEVGSLGQQSISISRDGSRVAFISDSDLDPDTIDDNGTRDVYVFTLPSFVEMQRFSANGLTSLNLRYEVFNTPVGGDFSIDIVRSPNEMFEPAGSDVLLAKIKVTEADDLSVGIHSLSFRIGGGPGEIPLPGAGAEELSSDKPVDYFLLAVAEVDGATEGPVLVVDTAVFAGSYHPPDGPLFVHGTAGNDSVIATTVDDVVSVVYSFDGGPFLESLFPPVDVTSIRARMHAGDDRVTGSGFADLILGGPGSDSLFGEAGRDTMDGGPGNDRVFGGDDFDRLFDSEGDDLVDTGGPEPFGGTINGVPGSDNIYIGAGQDTLSFEDARLAITLDARNPNLQTVDADGNGVQATGFSHFYGSPFDDQFSIGGNVPLQFTFDGGLGSDTLTVDAKGLPAINDGTRVQVKGFEPIEYLNFDRIDIINALPWVKATLDDHLVVDKNGNGKADPGDTLEYVVTIANDGVVDARDLVFEDILDPNTELVVGLINISPIALDDLYAVRGPLNVSSTSGLLANDFDIDGSVPGTNADLAVDVGSVTRISNPTTSTFTAQPDGSFTYTPEPGFSGIETFTYSITDSAGLSGDGVVNLIVNDMVWFINNSLPTNGDGSLNNPFNSLAPVNGSGGVGDVDGPSDTIFVFGGAGVYDQGLELEDNQSLIGEGHGLFLGGRDLVVPGLRPTLTNTNGDGIRLASNNTVRGLNIDGAAGSNVHADGAQRGQFQDVSLSGGTIGIDLHNTGGTFTFTNVSVSDPTGAAFNVNGGTSKIAFAADSTIHQSTSTGTGLHFNNASGTYNFNGGVTLDGGNAGINIAGGDATFLLPKLSMTLTGNAPAFEIKNHIRGLGRFGNDGLTLINGRRLGFDNASGDYEFNGDVTLGGGDAGIDILGGSGTFTFTDTTITDTGGEAAVNVQGHSGGTVTLGPGSSIDSTGGSGLQFDNADGIYNFRGDVTLKHSDTGIDILGESAGTFVFSDTAIMDPSGAGLNVENSRPNITFDGITVRGGTNGIRFEGVTGEFTVIGNTVIDNTTGASITVGNSRGKFQFGDTDIGQTTPVDTGIDINNSMGTFLFDDADIQTSGTDNVALRVLPGREDRPPLFYIQGGLSDIGIEVNDSGIHRLSLSSPSGGNIDGSPGDAIRVTNGSLFIDGVTFGANQPIGGDAISVTNTGGNDHSVDVINSTIIAPNGRGIVIDHGVPIAPSFNFGFGGLTPVVGNFDGQPGSGIGQYDSATGSWFLRNTPDTGVPDIGSFLFGPGGMPIVGDWDGDGIDTIGVYDPDTQMFSLRNTNSAGLPDITPFPFGSAGDVPVAGDWDGDGKDSIGVFRPTDGNWYLLNSSGSGPADQIVQFGLVSDIPVPSDYDGDGTTDLAVFRPGGLTWFVRPATGSGISSFQFGTSDDIPVAGDWDGDGGDTAAAVNPSVAGGTTSEWTLRGSNLPVGSVKVNVSGNEIVSNQAGIEVVGNGTGAIIATIANNTVQSNFNSIYAHAVGTGGANLELDLRDNCAGVYVISNDGVGNEIKLVGDLHTGQQLFDDDGGNVAARNNRLGNGVTLPTTNVNGLFVNGSIEIIAELTQLPGGGSGEGAAGNSHGNGLVGGEPPEGSRFSVELGTLPAGKRVQISFRATINDPLDAGVTQVANQGTVSGSNVDIFLTDDPATEALGDATITGELVMQRPTADLSLVMTVDNNSASIGQTVTFVIAVNNAGPNAATGVTVSDKLPQGLEFISASTEVGIYDSATGLWNVGSLAARSTVTLSIVAKLQSHPLASNVAQLATSDQFDPDSLPGNNALDEDDQFSVAVGKCLTGEPLAAGLNRIAYSCATPGGFVGFVVGSLAGKHYYSKYGVTVNIANPSVLAIGVGNLQGVAEVFISLTAEQIAQPLFVQAFEMLPSPKVSNLLSSHIDALTAILHELGHVLGLPDEPAGANSRLMSASLPPGVRRQPTAIVPPSVNALDVNRDGLVTPMDVLLIINELNRAEHRIEVAGYKLDVTGDGLLSPIDALQVINYLNGSRLLEGEGEAQTKIAELVIDESLLDALAGDALRTWQEARRNGKPV